MRDKKDHLKLDDFQTVENYKIKDSSEHHVQLLKKDNTFYFFKKLKNNSYPLASEIDIRSELLISEFLRIIIPREPETAMLFDDESNENKNSPIGLVSKQVEGFKSIDSIWFPKLVYLLFSSSIKGFGEICALLMLICEHDGKITGNLGLNKKKEVIKLDSGETMLARYDRDLSIRYRITAKDISRLPRAPSFINKRNITWLVTHPESNPWFLILWGLSFKKNMIHEINSTLLKFILIPEIFINHLIDEIITAPDCRPDDLKNQFTERMADAATSSLNTKSFCTYALSPTAEKDIEKFAQHLENFSSNGLKISEICPDFKKTMDIKFQSLKVSAEKQLAIAPRVSFEAVAVTIILLLCVYIGYRNSSFISSPQPIFSAP